MIVRFAEFCRYDDNASKIEFHQGMATNFAAGVLASSWGISRRECLGMDYL